MFTELNVHIISTCFPVYFVLLEVQRTASTMICVVICKGDRGVNLRVICRHVISRGSLEYSGKLRVYNTSRCVRNPMTRRGVITWSVKRVGIY